MDTKRIRVVDGIRGLCLLGILLANMLVFQYGILGREKLESFGISSFDQVWHWLLRIFIEGSFMPIFAFLFGFGMVKLAESLNRRGLRVKWTLARRAIGLLVLGILHAIFIWEGDILAAYALACLFLLLFVNRRKKTVLIWAVLLLCLTSLISYGSFNELKEMETAGIETYIEETTSIYQTGTYGEIINLRLDEEYMIKAVGLSGGKVVLIMLLMPIIFAPIFLFGMYAAKADWFRNYKDSKQFYLKGASLFIPVGVLFHSLYFILAEQSWTGIIFTLSGVILPLGYIFLIAYFYPRLTKLHPYIEAVGKLSLTNYLLHSVICTSIFYGYGFGLFGKIGVFAGVLLSLVIYTVLAVLSEFYLRRWKVGPMERFLRIGTYLTLSGKPKNKKMLNEKTAS
ncbi:DUF418 domain-containing protein [Virgibacillus sp. C22-A2]|uniref:DUF418 domain-containing protein n=1 Tax=Virgibacillus tibetensis TaxID=3042313 RepID=A0ABU6KDV5_9BACI|nr:DUF418 domain-containing protein [Virgibacillus sp. C22-A2]